MSGHANGALADALRTRFGVRARLVPLGVSAFTGTYRLEALDARYFVKAVPSSQRAVLEGEADGLQAIAATGTIRTPAVAVCSTFDGGAFLALEWLDFAPPDRAFGARLGEHLAALHAAAPPISGWGWPRTHWLGGTAQDNMIEPACGLAGWCRFVAERRLLPLTERLADPALCVSVERVIARLPEYFADGYVPRPSLIHGDLWQGNWAMLASGEPVVFDPAVSVSDAEAELAMMELFGAPPAGFAEAWQAVHGPRGPLASLRRALYQLYHLLNHALLFGGSYRRQALAVATRLAQQSL